MIRNPKVSVIMPVFNAEPYINHSIESILNQSFVDFEFIIIDDASTDTSKKIIKSYDDSRIILIENNENKGYVFGLNYAINIAKGKFIVRMDADDISLHNRIEFQLTYMEMNENVGVCGSYVEYFGDKKGIWAPPIENNNIKSGLINGSTFCHPSVMIRKSVLINNEIIYSNDFLFAEDFFLWHQLMQVTDFYNVPNVLLKYRITETQVSSVFKCRQDNLKKEIQLRSLLLIDEQNLLKLDELFKPDLESMILLGKLNELIKMNQLKSIYEVNSFNAAISIFILNKLSIKKSLPLLFVFKILIGPFSKTWSIRMKLGLIKRGLTIN